MKLVITGIIVCISIPFFVYLLTYLASRAWEMGKLEGIREFSRKYKLINKEKPNGKKG